MPRGCSPGKLLQLPGAQVQAPRVGRLLQGALQTAVQGQVEARAARASVMLVVLVEMRVQGGDREGGRESLGFASRRRHLLPVPPYPAAPARGHRFPPPPASRRPRVPAALPRRPRDGGRGGAEPEAAARSLRFPAAEAEGCGGGGARVSARARARPPLLLLRSLSALLPPTPAATGGAFCLTFTRSGFFLRLRVRELFLFVCLSVCLRLFGRSAARDEV